MHPSIRSRRTLAMLAALSLAALAGCKTAAPGVPPVTDGSANVPTTEAGAPVAPPADTAPVPSSQDSSNTSTSRIQLLDVQPGKPASFTTQPGKSLTVVASAASYSPNSPAFKLSVSPWASAYRTQAYHLASATPSGPWPYSHQFGETNATYLAQAKPVVGGARHLQDVTERQLGTQDTFWINTGDSTLDGDKQQTATLKRVSPHAYFYVDNQAKPISDAQLDGLVSQWEANIYPKVTGAFGSEAQPGVDGDNHLFIVLSPAVDNWGKEKGLMGYFWSRDAIPGASASTHSNQKEALFMTDQLFDYPALTSFGTLAHEFQHLINFSQKAARTGYTVSEETWLDEGMSMYAMEAAGYGLPAGDKLIAKDLNEFEQNPAAYSLTDWSGNPHGFAYGQSYLFVHYLVDRYGAGILKEILQDDRAGVAGLEDVLAKHQDNFSSFFRAWTITNLVSGGALADNTPYQYKGINLAGNYGGFQLAGFKVTPATSADVTADLRPWGSAYYTFSSGNAQTWSFNLGDTGSTRLLGAAIVP